MRFQRHCLAPILAVLVGAAWRPAAAQFSHPGCTDLKAADFKVTEMFNRNGTGGVATSDNTLSEPVQMDLRPVKRGDSTVVDIYFVERLGKVKYYDGAAKKVSLMGSVPTWGKADNGVMGIALHPDFANNRWIYIWYSPPIANQSLNRRLRLSRFTASVQNTLEMGTEKILIDILGSKSDNWHSGGPMAFDSYGDLWVTVGNNSPDLNPDALNVMSKTDSTQSAEWGPSSTASLRGGVFRIHPDSSAKGYRVPSGNFGEYWAAEFEKQGKAALAAQYRDPAKVFPEVYVKGSRSNYSIAVHPVKRWLAWGEVNYSSNNDELNLVTKPSFAGYPYFHNNNLPTGNHGMDPAAPKNSSPLNSGVTELPPAVPGMVNNLVNVVIGGPFYFFNSALASRTKFPPHLHNSWITFAFSANQMHIHTLDSTQVKIAKTTRVDNGLLAALKLRNAVQAKYGPEGSLYVLNYDGFYNHINPAITRVDYAGDCNPVSVAPVAAGGPRLDVTLSPGRLKVGEPGSHEVRVHDMRGTLRFRSGGSSATEYRWGDIRRQAGLEPGLYTVQVLTARGRFLGTQSLL